ncbi:MAG: hemerythrin domain-containing protein, partial [Brevundimonas sp.]|nr:hemerythrin domain-containing protein [Brevundimonas sp.]
MQPKSGRLDLISPADPGILRRWGLSDCDRIDHSAMCDSLARLQHDDAPPPSTPTHLIGHIRDHYRHALIAVIEDAIALATVCEGAHSGDDLWPHGLSDRLIEIHEALEHHHQREDAVVIPMLLADGPRGARSVKLMEAEHADIRARLDAVLALTGGFAVPPQACAGWRVLYVLCCKIDVDSREQIRLEEQELFPLLIRESTDVA